MKKIMVLIILSGLSMYAAAVEAPEKSSCNKGNMDSCAQLATMYLYGNGVEQNQALAFKYFTKACDSGQPTGACTYLGSMYRNGMFVKQDYQHALRLLTVSCNNNEFSSCAELAGIYEEGDGVRKNEKLALKYKEKACKGGYKIVCPGTVHEKLGIK